MEVINTSQLSTSQTIYLHFFSRVLGLACTNQKGKVSRDPLSIKLCVCSLSCSETLSLSVIIEIALLEPNVSCSVFSVVRVLYSFSLCVLKVSHILLVVKPEDGAFLSTVVLVVSVEAVRTTA